MLDGVVSTVVSAVTGTEQDSSSIDSLGDIKDEIVGVGESVSEARLRVPIPAWEVGTSRLRG